MTTRAIASLDLAAGQHLCDASLLFLHLLRDIRAGAHRMGGRSPVWMSCSTASVWPVSGSPGIGKMSHIPTKPLPTGVSDPHLGYRSSGQPNLVDAGATLHPHHNVASHRPSLLYAVPWAIIPTSCEGVHHDGFLAEI